jgi:hypothetical protein
MLVEKGQAVHHPGVKACARVARDLAYDVEPVP